MMKFNRNKQNKNRTGMLLLTKNVYAVMISFLFIAFGSECIAQTTVTYQPDATDGQDAWVRDIDGCPSGSPSGNSDNTNYGNNDLLIAMAWSYNSPQNCDDGYIRSYIRFDELSNLPTNAVVSNATLILHGVSQADVDPEYGNSQHPGTSLSSNPIRIGQVSQSWDEQTINWNNQPSAVFGGGVTHPASTSQFNETISIDVTTLVQNQINTGNNYGYRIQLQNEAKYRSWFWASSDFHDPAQHPELVVEYEVVPPCNANFTYCYNTETMQFTFTPNSTINVPYNWDFGDNSDVSTPGPSSVPHTYSQAGTYKVCLKTHVPNGKKCKVCIEICVSPDQVEVTSDYEEKGKKNNNNSSENGNVSIGNLYPNPATNNFTIEIDTEKSGKGILLIHDMTGKKISEKSIAVIKGVQSLTHEFTDLSKGMYLCTLLINNERASKSFVIE